MLNSTIKKEVSAMAQKIKRNILKIKDPGSALTHFTAMILAAAAAVPLLIKGSRSPAQFHLAALAVFILSMVGLYAASTIYHTLDISPKVNRLLRKIDHMMIFVLIAGTYTPVCFIVLGDGNPDQRLLDHLSQMVFLHGVHCHGLGMCPGIFKDPHCPSKGRIYMAAGRRHHLYPGRHHLRPEAACFQFQAPVLRFPRDFPSLCYGRQPLPLYDDVSVCRIKISSSFFFRGSCFI